LDLRSKKTGDFIEERHSLCNALRNICDELGIVYCNIANAFGDMFLEDVMKDGTHYTLGKGFEEQAHNYVAHMLKEM
jgi:hypothetical protein